MGSITMIHRRVGTTRSCSTSSAAFRHRMHSRNGFDCIDACERPCCSIYFAFEQCNVRPTLAAKIYVLIWRVLQQGTRSCVRRWRDANKTRPGYGRAVLAGSRRVEQSGLTRLGEQHAEQVVMCRFAYAGRMAFSRTCHVQGFHTTAHEPFSHFLCWAGIVQIDHQQWFPVA